MEVFRTDRFEEVSLSDWLAHSPIDMVSETLNIDSSLLATSSRPKSVGLPRKWRNC
jgi:oxalate decarboxylase